MVDGLAFLRPKENWAIFVARKSKSMKKIPLLALLLCRLRSPKTSDLTVTAKDVNKSVVYRRKRARNEMKSKTQTNLMAV